MSDPWKVVVCGVAVLDTGAARPVMMGWRADGEGGAWFLECEGRRLEDVVSNPEQVRRYTRLIFVDGDGGGQQVEPAEVVNLDGSPRNALRDRIARRGVHLESLAAD